VNLPPDLTAKCLRLAGVEPAAKPKRARKPPKAPPVFPAGTLPRVRLDTPPPTTNNLFTQCGKQRVKSAEYRAWLRYAVPVLRTLARPALPCRYSYLLVGKWLRRCDGANREKGLVDAAVQAGVIPDDSLEYVRGGVWDWLPTEAEPAVLLWFEPWEAWGELKEAA